MKKLISALLAISIVFCCAFSVMAAPSIGELVPDKEVTVDQEKLPEALKTDDNIIIGAAKTEEYTGTAASIIEKAQAAAVSEEGEPAATVAEIFEDVTVVATEDAPAVELSSLKQLTAMLDFKFEKTDMAITDAGVFEEPVEVGIKGGEITKGGSIDDFIILQLNPETNEVYVLTMKTYDPETGDFTVDFPCFGPYMVTLKG